MAADTDEEARFHFTSLQQAFTNMTRGKRGQFPKPINDIETYWSPTEKAMASQMLECSIVGQKETVRIGLQRLIEKTQADEVMLTSSIYDLEARLKSLAIVASL